MFGAQFAHHQEVNDLNCTYKPLVSSLSASDRLVQQIMKDWLFEPTQPTSPSLEVAQDGHLQRVTIPEAAYVQFTSLTS
jgi:hypothetical protein